MSPTFNISNDMTSAAGGSQQEQASSSNNNAISQPQAMEGATSTTATASATTSTKHHNQHPISQLPMTTRKKLSHLRAQIKRQASKAAGSRLEKRSSVSGSGGDKSSSAGHFGVSLDAGSSKYQVGDGHYRELHNQPNSSSSTESPSAYLSNQSTSSPGPGGNLTSDSNVNTTLSPSSQDGGGPGPSGNAKHLVGQHSLAALGHHHHHHSLHQKNFKQKIIALLKKFRTDDSDFDSEEQYRAALERELLAVGRDPTAIDELLEEDIDAEEESGSEPEDWDNISETSTPKPSLRPFFSSTTLDNNTSSTLERSNNMTSDIPSSQQDQASSTNNNAINQPQATEGATSTTATASATTSTKHHNQHPISQLPMTTRKKLSHLHAQIKRQASKAARSRLEKRSSVSGSGGDKSSNAGLVSLDVASSSKHQVGDGHHRELLNQPNSSSSTESPSAYLSNQSTSSPVAGGNQTSESIANTTLSPSSQDGGGSGPSGSAKHLVGQHSLAAPGQHGHNHHHHHHSLHQKNFKQKIIALLKKFRTDDSDFDSEEQYRAALERELLAVGRDSTAIDELLEEGIDVEGESGSEPEDWDNISETSTPKPSLRPFFSSTTLDKI